MKTPVLRLLFALLVLSGCKNPHSGTSPSGSQKPVVVPAGQMTQGSLRNLPTTGFPEVRVKNPGSHNSEIVVPAGVQADTRIIPER